MFRTKSFLLVTLLLFFVFMVVIPVVFLFVINASQPGEVVQGVFCVSNTSQIMQGLLHHPSHIFNIWLIDFSGSAYCGTPFYVGISLIGALLFLLQTVGVCLFISLLLAFLLLKSLPLHAEKKNKPSQKRYLMGFLAVIVFLIIRYIKNGFSNPLLLQYGGDLMNFLPHLSYQQAILNAFLYGPTANLNRTDPQVYTAALYSSFVLDALVSLLVGFIVVIIVQSRFLKTKQK